MAKTPVVHHRATGEQMKLNVEVMIRELKGIEGDIWHMLKNHDPQAIMERLRQVRRRLEPLQRLSETED
jgi:hypothetical protein